MLLIPVIYDDTTRSISLSKEWAGTEIDDRSTTFSVSGIPEDAVSAKLDIKVSIKQANKKEIRPFLILNGIRSGTGTATVPAVLFQACKRDLKFIFQLEIMTEEETYASKNWITLKVSPSIVRRPSELPLWDQDQVMVDAYELESGEGVVFKRFSGDEFTVLIGGGDLQWERIKNVPWRNQWTTGVPTDRDILVESFIHTELNKKTDVLHAIPSWDAYTVYDMGSIVVDDQKIYESKIDQNEGHHPSDPQFWSPISSAGSSSFRATIGDGTTRVFEVEHNLGTKHFTINLIDAYDGRMIMTPVRVIDDSKIEITFTSPPMEYGVNVIIIPATVSRSSFVFHQEVPTNPWYIVHGLGRKVIVKLYDENMEEMEADIRFVDDGHIFVAFTPEIAEVGGWAVII